MGEVVNLRQARKRKAREQAEQQAAENRAAYGRSSKAKAADKAVEALDRRRLDSHRRENGGDVEA